MATEVEMSFIAPDLEAESARIFWEGCRQRKLLMPFCDSCRRVRWYPTTLCPNCRTGTMTWHPVSGRGTLYTYTVVHRSFRPELTSWLPYISGLVTLEGAEDARFVTRIVSNEQPPVIGMPVEVAFTQVAPDLVLPFFRPASASGGGEAKSDNSNRP